MSKHDDATGPSGPRRYASQDSAPIKESGTLTLDEWRELQDVREAAKAALRAETLERERARPPGRGFSLRVIPVGNGCVDCEWIGDFCSEHTEVYEYETDTGIQNRKEGTATGELSDERICLSCSLAFRAPARRGQPPVTCSDVCAKTRGKALDRARKAGRSHQLPDTVKAAQEAAGGLWGHPVPMRPLALIGHDEFKGFIPMEWSPGGNPKEGQTVRGLVTLGSETEPWNAHL